MNKMYIRKAGTYEVFCFFCLFSLFSLFSFNLFAQVGIGTVNPNGILDVQSTTQGVVIPRVALTDTYLMAPITNPNGGGGIPVGTVVFNTATTSQGKIAGVSDDVSRGMYFWEGTKWVPQFTRKQYKLISQTSQNLRTRSGISKDVTGINGETFTATYTGTYKIELSVNYGGGQCENPIQGNGAGKSDGTFNVGRQSGDFRFSYDGTTNYNTFKVGSFSTAIEGSNGGGPNGRAAGNYFGIWKQWTKVYYVKLTRGDVLNFRLNFLQDSSPEFLLLGNDTSASGNNDGTYTGGNGHVGFDVPCFVEVSFIDEQ